MWMRATKICRPGGSGTKQRQVGEEFDLTPQMAAIAQALKWAVPAPEPVEEEVEEVEEQDQPEPIMNAAARKTAKKAAKKAKVVVEKPAKRTYNTRRLTAKR